MLAAILEAILAALAKMGLTWLQDRKAASDLQTAERSDAMQTAANETSEVVKEAADARSQIVTPADPGSLAAELRERAKRAAGGDAPPGK